MKKTHLFYIYTLLLATLAFCFFNYLSFRDRRIACIDTARVLEAYNGVKELSASLDNKTKNFNARLDTLVKEFQAAMQDYEKKRSTLSEKEIQTEETKLRLKQEAYSQFGASNQEVLKKEEMKIIQAALGRINEKIIRFAKKENYSAVFGITPTSGVIYANDYIDITADVIKIINK